MLDFVVHIVITGLEALKDKIITYSNSSER